MQADIRYTEDITTIADIVYEKLELGTKVPVQTVMDEARQVLSVLGYQTTIKPQQVLINLEQRHYVHRHGPCYTIK